MELLSNTNFGKSVKSGDFDELIKDIQLPMESVYQIKLRFRDNYDDFLSQPLTLSMFVPTDLDGNLLEEPNGTDLNDSFFSMQVDYNLEKKYAEAQSRVLFEGFIIKEEKYELPKSAQPNENKKWSVRSVSLLHNDRIVTMLTQPERAFDEMTIESLLEHFPTLTETATTQIFG